MTHLALINHLQFSPGDRLSREEFLELWEQMRTRVCELATNATWLMLESAPQPDAALWLLPEFGGSTTLPDKLASGAPELVAEVCQSSRSYDLGPKLSLYQRAGVSEYIAVLIKEARIEWRVLETGGYRLMKPDEAGIFHSKIFPGLWLDEPAYWRKDSARLLAVLEEGLRSDEHAAFLKLLNA